MKKTTLLICTGMIAASCALAQTAPPATQPPPAAGGRQQRVQTPEQIAAAKAQAEALNADHQNMMDQLHITSLRPGKNGTDTAAANFTNYDESKANPYPVWPDALTF
jgi:hypothetical protein